jgi:NADPH:quinone reductase-like Zn-dependent oxidoreductase
MTMLAAVYEYYGPPEVLHVRDVPIPVPTDNQIRIAVGATTVTAACGMMRRGNTLMARVVLGLFRPRTRFRIMGMEIAGVVESVGSRVTQFRPGDRE